MWSNQTIDPYIGAIESRHCEAVGNISLMAHLLMDLTNQSNNVAFDG